MFGGLVGVELVVVSWLLLRVAFAERKSTFAPRKRLGQRLELASRESGTIGPERFWG